MPPRRRRFGTRNTTSFEIEGLREFLREIGLLDREIAQAEKVFAAVAASTVAVRAKEMARFGSRLASLSSADVKVAGPGTVEYGGEGYSMGAEFGALQYKQFEIWRGNKDDAGYFFWPAIREFRDKDMLDLWVEEVWKAVKPLFPERG